MKVFIRSRWGVRLLALAMAILGRCLFTTVRRETHVSSPGTNPFEISCRGSYLYSVWHDVLVMAAFFRRHHRMTALSSLHRDGTLVAEFNRFVNMGSVQGSSSRISPGAMKALLKCLATRHLVITPDGPLGPRHTMSQGLVFLASRTGCPIMPSGFGCSRAWRIPGSWTDMVVPKPFSRVVLVIRDPIYVPRDLRSTELASWMARVKEAMDEAQGTAEALAQNRQQPCDSTSSRAAA